MSLSSQQKNEQQELVICPSIKPTKVKDIYNFKENPLEFRK